MAHVCFLRVDGVLKHLTESRDFDHRLRALENEVRINQRNYDDTVLILIHAINYSQKVKDV